MEKTPWISEEWRQPVAFLPNLCRPTAVFFLLLVTELLVMVSVLLESGLRHYDWQLLSLRSLFCVWVVLSSAAILCALRVFLNRRPLWLSSLLAYLVILAVTAVISYGGQWSMAGKGMLRNWFSVGVTLRDLVIAAVFGGIALRYWYLRQRLALQEQAELHARIGALQARIRPHFLFNTMNSIASLIAIDPKIAEELVEDLCQLLRASLNDHKVWVPLSEELELCRRYGHIEQMRIGARLQMQWPDETQLPLAYIPSIALQPLVENAVYHGVQTRPEGGLVVVAIEVEDDWVAISVRNPLSLAPTKSGFGLAQRNIRDRLQVLCGEQSSFQAGPEGDEYVVRLRYRQPPELFVVRSTPEGQLAMPMDDYDAKQ